VELNQNNNILCRKKIRGDILDISSMFDFNESSDDEKSKVVWKGLILC